MGYSAATDHCALLQHCDRGVNKCLWEGKTRISTSLRLNTIVFISEDSRNRVQEHNDKQPGHWRSHSTVI